jgi:thiosulfate dehydrogenase [quinone] large subunit
MKETVALWMLLPLRLFVGQSLIRAGLSKIANHWLTEARLELVVNGWLASGKPAHFYEGFLRDVVVPHHHMFATMVVMGEIGVGAALVLGVFTRPAAALGLLMVFNFFLGQGESLNANSTAAYLAMLLTLVLVPSGRVLGVDAFLRGKVPRWLS